MAPPNTARCSLCSRVQQRLPLVPSSVHLSVESQPYHCSKRDGDGASAERLCVASPTPLPPHGWRPRSLNGKREEAANKVFTEA